MKTEMVGIKHLACGKCLVIAVTLILDSKELVFQCCVGEGLGSVEGVVYISSLLSVSPLHSIPL